MQSLKINLPFALLCLALVVVNVFQLAYAEKADQVFDILMGSDVAPRKRFIQTRAKEVKNLDV